ncbi:hypothetical protein NIIDMKKI_52710 [Mycobacterium kansasii]|uniref:Uncharacterized protein n=1 Tax=Mycobacterium kansasii TaxID=1768 RepID=A0A7G1IJZ8_MYCKA|nr:hypothetical protein NIIDMKKI_52710 [Mycobacterium kansasii]
MKPYRSVTQHSERVNNFLAGTAPVVIRERGVPCRLTAEPRHHCPSGTARVPAARAARVWAADGIGAAVQCRVCEWSAGAFRRGLSAARTKAATEAQPRQTGRRSG